MHIIKKNGKEALIGLICGLVNGMFGSGGGTVVVPMMEKMLHFSPMQSHPTTILIVLIISLSSSIFYVLKGYFDLGLWFYVSLGGVAGGVVGAKILSKIPKKWLKITFGAVILFGAYKMIFK